MKEHFAEKSQYRLSSKFVLTVDVLEDAIKVGDTMVFWTKTIGKCDVILSKQ